MRLLFVTLIFLLTRRWPGRRPAQARNDPSLVWHTIETPHFRVTYYSGEAEVAQHVADLAEAINTRLAPIVGWKVSERTEIVLTDQTDSANGSATAIPFNAIRLFITAPSDLSPLGDVDDWYQELVTHEYTHILHTDHIRGIPALINIVLGKTYAPNQAQAKWLLEGLAVLEESDHTSGGRLRSSQWNMFMRADVLEGNVAPLDVFSNTPRRWPQGNIYYVYGSFFMQWLDETYGDAAIRRMIDDYGSQLIPWGVNRSIKRATGRTYEDMYPSFVDTLRREFTAQADGIRARGLREGKRVTFAGYTAEHPRWIPKNAWDDHGGDLLYYRDDGNDRSGFYALPVTRDATGRVTNVRDQGRELMIRTNGDGSPSFEPDGGVVFSNTDITNNLYAFNDLFELPAGLTSPTGLDGHRVRWSEGYRAVDPDVSPDGRRVAFATNHRGTTTLQIADIVAGGIAHTRALVRGESFDQAFTPRWSPDNVHLAYSAWSRGGYRDVRVVDTTDGSFVSVTNDRALDQDPSYSADGKTLYFTSDRTGVMNVYAWDVATHDLKQVTNVVNGAYYPEVSPDGKTLAYIGYTAVGFDMFVMPLDPSSFLPALPYENYRPEAAAHPRAPQLPDARLQPAPHALSARVHGQHRAGPVRLPGDRVRQRRRHRRAPQRGARHHEHVSGRDPATRLPLLVQRAAGRPELPRLPRAQPGQRVLAQRQPADPVHAGDDRLRVRRARTRSRVRSISSRSQRRTRSSASGRTWPSRRVRSTRTRPRASPREGSSESPTSAGRTRTESRICGASGKSTVSASPPGSISPTACSGASTADSTRA